MFELWCVGAPGFVSGSYYYRASSSHFARGGRASKRARSERHSICSQWQDCSTGSVTLADATLPCAIDMQRLCMHGASKEVYGGSTTGVPAVSRQPGVIDTPQHDVQGMFQDDPSVTVLVSGPHGRSRTSLAPQHSQLLSSLERFTLPRAVGSKMQRRLRGVQYTRQEGRHRSPLPTAQGVVWRGRRSLGLADAMAWPEQFSILREPSKTLLAEPLRSRESGRGAVWGRSAASAA